MQAHVPDHTCEHFQVLFTKKHNSPIDYFKTTINEVNAKGDVDVYVDGKQPK